MTYQVLARKWRPRRFDELVGQEHVVRALTHAIDGDRLHHGFLFTGTRGVGKTTIARILAKCLNCETGMSSAPCGRCNTCTEIDEGRYVDLIEVDAASRSGVDGTRELMDNVHYAPGRGRYKVYLIDEVHMFSMASFNALLKTLEEPPPHVKFLLATTDPQKIPVTVLSRCLQFNLKRLPRELIQTQLERILTLESIEFEVAAVRELARAADGSMRDALSLLDQAIAHGAGKLLALDVQQMLGTLDRRHLHALLDALQARDAAALLERVAQMAGDAGDFAQALSELVAALQRLAVLQVLPQSLADDEPDRDWWLAKADAISAEDIQLFYQIGIVARRDMPYAPDPRSGFEMALIRMVDFVPDDGSGGSGGRGGRATSRPADGGSPPEAGSSVGAPVQAPVEASLGLAAEAARRPSTPLPAASEASSTVAPAPDRAVGPSLPPADDGPPMPPPEVSWLVPGDDGPAPSDRAAPRSFAPSSRTSSNEVSSRAGSTVDERAGGVPAIDAPATDTPAAVVGADPSTPAETALPADRGGGDAPSRERAEAWLDMVEGLGVQGFARELALNCVPVGELDGGADDVFRLLLTPSHEPLNNVSAARALATALSEYHGRTLRVEIDLRDSAAPTPAQIKAEREAARRAAAVQAMQADPLVRQLGDAFGAELIEASVRPHDGARGNP
ncbi:MAG: DNA polymerase III subunit gamma/tau [Gammaproteobacteria bacterium]|nr:DNA polymerase III subunit gamma/tau [Gammaproteobacteria bacterium]